MRVLTHDQQGAQVEYWVNAVVSKYHYVLYRHYDEPGRRLTWTRVAGDLSALRGVGRFAIRLDRMSKCWSTSHID